MSSTVARSWVETVLGRPEHEISTDEPLRRLAGETVLVTGAAGSIGLELVEQLERADVKVIATDIDTFDVRLSPTRQLLNALPRRMTVFHLAGAKHAPAGERDPWAVCETNTIGTRNVLKLGVRVVLASTCKAADPETAYGASKLLAERMVMHAGGTVARFYNVVESDGNVFETWAAIPAKSPLPVTNCHRYFISLQEAVALLLWAAILPGGRYSIAEPRARWMPEVASWLYPKRPWAGVELRRGDRGDEPLHARSERLEQTDVDGIVRVTSRHEAAR